MPSRLDGDQRRALEVLADAGLRGCTGATMLERGFKADMLAGLIQDGYVTAAVETMRMRGRKIRVARMRITNAGYTALEREAGLD